jgi:predicted ABC-type ATPase
MIRVSVSVHIWFGGHIIKEATVKNNFFDLANAVWWALEEAERLEIAQVSQCRKKIDGVSVSVNYSPAQKNVDIGLAMKDVQEARESIVDILPEDDV